MRRKPKQGDGVRSPYKVDYHFLQVIYFDRDRVLTGPQLAQVWSGFKIFGQHRVIGSFWQRNGDSVSSVKQSRFDLGSLEQLERMLSDSDPVYGGGTFTKNNADRGTIQDCDFYFTHKDPSRWNGIDVRPEFNLAVSGEWFEKTGVKKVLAKIKEHFELADVHSPPYGLIDLATPEDAFAGFVYGSLWMLKSPLHRWVENGNWVYSASKRGDRVRGIYWGNYFGPKILERLGGRQNFVDRYRAQARLADRTPSAHIWEFTNGVFVSLCLNPLGCKPGVRLDHSAEFNLRWLHNELGSKGALCGWCNDHGEHEQQLVR